MKNRFTWLHMLLTPMSAYDRHGGEVIYRRPRMEQPLSPCHPGIETDARPPSPVLAGGSAAHIIALAARREPV